MRLEQPLNNAIDEHPNNHLASGSVPVAEEEGNAFRDIECYDFLDEIDEFDIDNFHNSFLDIDLDHDDADADRMVNQLFNNNDEQIQDSNVSDTTRTEHVLLQQEFQDPLSQQLNTSFNQTTPHSLYQAEAWDPHPEMKNGVIICTLNTESDDIPDNDDFNPLLWNPKAQNSVIPSSPSLRKHMRPPLPLIRGSSSSQARGNDMIRSYGFGDSAVTTQASSSTAFQDSFTENATSSFTATTSASLQHSTENEIVRQILSSAEMDINAPMLEEQEENNNEIESDEDLPSYSDVEDMVCKTLSSLKIVIFYWLALLKLFFFFLKKINIRFLIWTLNRLVKTGTIWKVNKLISQTVIVC